MTLLSMDEIRIDTKTFGYVNYQHLSGWILDINFHLIWKEKIGKTKWIIDYNLLHLQCCFRVICSTPFDARWFYYWLPVRTVTFKIILSWKQLKKSLRLLSLLVQLLKKFLTAFLTKSNLCGQGGIAPLFFIYCTSMIRDEYGPVASLSVWMESPIMQFRIKIFQMLWRFNIRMNNSHPYTIQNVAG